MDREALIEAVYAKTDLDMDMIDAMTTEQLRDILGLNNAPQVKPELAKPAPVKPAKVTPRLISTEYTEQDGRLFVLRTYSDNSQSLVHAAQRVHFDGRTVSAAIVLHWLRTGEWVHRVPRTAKTIQAAIRHNGRVIHLGRFATIEEAQEAKNAARFRVSVGLDPLGRENP